MTTVAGKTRPWIIPIVFLILCGMFGTAAPVRATPNNRCVGSPTSVTCNTTHSTIQAAVNAAVAGDTVIVAAGTYNENVVVNTSNITLRGEGDDPFGTVLDGNFIGSTGFGIWLNNNVTGITIEKIRIINNTSNSNASGIYGGGGNNDLIIRDVTVNNNGPGYVSASGGIYLNGPINNVLITNVTAHNNTGRGIVIWNGFKTNITITNNNVQNNNCCGIELQDGTASGVTMTGNTVVNNADSGMSAVGLTSGAGPNLIANNTVTNNGRFGIEIKLPNGTGADSGDGSIVVENNTVSRSGIPTDLRDHAGIAVFRRGWVAGYNNADIPAGVIVRNNTVTGYQQPSASTGFGVVVEGRNVQVLNNTLTNNDVGVQVQAGHTLYTPYTNTDGNQANLSDNFFGRGNSPVACARVSGNGYTGSTEADFRLAGGTVASSNPDKIRIGTSALPSVTSIVRAGSNPVNAASVSFIVTFSDPVTGVDALDFSLTTTGGISGAGVTGVSGSGVTYTVTVNTGSGDGTIRLDLKESASIENLSTKYPIFCGYDAGEAYTIDKTAPTLTITSTSGNPTGVTPIPLTFTFDEMVTGFTAGDVTVSNGSLSGFSGGGAVYTANVIPSSDGPVTVTVTAGAAQDAAGNGNTAATFTTTYDSVAPVVLSITCPITNLTSAYSVTFIVTFSRNVTDVDVTDFSLTATGGMSGASVAGVSGSGSVYTVTVSIVPAGGTLRLDLIDNDSIKDIAGNSLGGTGAGNGNFTDSQVLFSVLLAPIFR